MISGGDHGTCRAVGICLRIRGNPAHHRRQAMIRLALALAGGTLFSTTAFAQSAVPTAEFVKKVEISDMLEIQSSEFVAPKADEDTKPFAEKMIKDHSETSKELKGLVQSGKVKA